MFIDPPHATQLYHVIDMPRHTAAPSLCQASVDLIKEGIEQLCRLSSSERVQRATIGSTIQTYVERAAALSDASAVGLHAFPHDCLTMENFHSSHNDSQSPNRERVLEIMRKNITDDTHDAPSAETRIVAEHVYKQIESILNDLIITGPLTDAHMHSIYAEAMRKIACEDLGSSAHQAASAEFQNLMLPLVNKVKGSRNQEIVQSLRHTADGVLLFAGSAFASGASMKFIGESASNHLMVSAFSQCWHHDIALKDTCAAALGHGNAESYRAKAVDARLAGMESGVDAMAALTLVSASSYKLYLAGASVRKLVASHLMLREMTRARIPQTVAQEHSYRSIELTPLLPNQRGNISVQQISSV